MFLGPQNFRAVYEFENSFVLVVVLAGECSGALLVDSLAVWSSESLIQILVCYN